MVSGESSTEKYRCLAFLYLAHDNKKVKAHFWHVTRIDKAFNKIFPVQVVIKRATFGPQSSKNDLT